MEIEAAVFAGRGTQQVKQATTLEEAAREFEAMMLVELLKAARKAGDAFGVQNDDNGARSYQEFADEHLAKALAAQDALVLTCESKAFNCKMSVWQDRQR